MASTRRGVASILGGSAGAQLIALAVAPLISRLYTADQYGPFAVVSASAMAIMTLMALRLDLAIPAVDSDDEAVRLARFGVEAAIGTTTLGIVVSWPLRNTIAHHLSLTNAGLAPFIPLIAGLTATYTVLNQMAIRLRKYSAIGRRNLLQGAAVALLQLLFGWLGFGSAGLAIGMATGQLVGVVSLAASLSGVAWFAPSLNRRNLLRRFRSYPLVMAPSGLVNSLGLQAPVLLTASFFGAAASGWLGMTQRILALPVGLIGLALAQVFLGEFGAARRAGDKDLERLFLRTSRALAVVAGAIGLVVVALGPWGFAIVLGEQWRSSGHFARALAVGMVGQMVAAPLSQTLIALGRVKLQAIWDVTRLIVCAGTVWACEVGGASVQTTMWALGVATAATYLASWLLSWFAVRRHVRTTSGAGLG